MWFPLGPGIKPTPPALADQLFITEPLEKPLSLILKILLKYNWFTMLCCCFMAKSCPTLSNPMDCSPSDFSAHGISQAGILGWVVSFFRGSSRPKVEGGTPHCRQNLYQLSHQGSPIYLSIFLYTYSLFHCGLSRILNIVPCAKTLWLIHPINNLHLRIPNSQYIPPQLPFPLEYCSFF